MLVVVVVVAVPVPGGELGADVVVDGLGVLDGRLHPHQILFRRRHLLRCGVATRADGLHALAVALDRLRERDVLRRARGFATRQLMMHRRLESFLGRLHGGRELRARAGVRLGLFRGARLFARGDFAPRPAAATSLAPAFRFLPLGGEREEDEDGSDGKDGAACRPVRGNGGGEGCGETTRADTVWGDAHSRARMCEDTWGRGARADDGRGKEKRRRRPSVAPRAEAAGCGGRDSGMGRGRGARRARAARSVGVFRAPLVVSLLALGRASRSRPRARPCTARSQPPRAGGAGTLSDFLHLSLSCTPVRPLRRFGVGCEGERGNQRGFKARVGREEARGAPKRARAADAPRDQPPTISTLIPRAPSRAVRTRDSWVARSSHRTIFCAGRGRRGGNAGRARLGPSAGDALEHFEVRVVPHLLPRPDAVLLHGVTKRLLLLVVPVPSEWHLAVQPSCPSPWASWISSRPLLPRVPRSPRPSRSGVPRSRGGPRWDDRPRRRALASSRARELAKLARRRLQRTRRRQLKIDGSRLQWVFSLEVLRRNKWVDRAQKRRLLAVVTEPSAKVHRALSFDSQVDNAQRVRLKNHGLFPLARSVNGQSPRRGSHADQQVSRPTGQRSATLARRALR